MSKATLNSVKKDMTLETHEAMRPAENLRGHLRLLQRHHLAPSWGALSCFLPFFGESGVFYKDVQPICRMPCLALFTRSIME